MAGAKRSAATGLAYGEYGVPGAYLYSIFEAHGGL